MTVSLSISSANGTFTFSDIHAMPLIQRSYTNVRPGGDTGDARQTVSMTINGFFRGNKHEEIVAKYIELKNILNASDIKVFYHDGSQTVLNNKVVYLDSVNEPLDWKQYFGDYEITLHYFVEPTVLSYINLPVSYSSQHGSFLFERRPVWQSKTSVNRNDFQGKDYSFTGRKIGRDITVTLTGTLTAPNHNALSNKVDNLNTVLRSDGVLNYGNWTNNVRVVGFDIPSVFPENYVDYSITFSYFTEDIRRIESTVSYDRLHPYAIIRHRRYCSKPIVKTFPQYNGGQNISYNINLQASSVSAAKDILKNEMLVLIHGGGIELEGGKTEYNYDNSSVQFSSRFFYETPILQNIEE